MLTVSATSGVAGTTREHLGLALALEVPFFVVVTKQDVTRAQVILSIQQPDAISLADLLNWLNGLFVCLFFSKNCLFFFYIYSGAGRYGGPPGSAAEGSWMQQSSLPHRIGRRCDHGQCHVAVGEDGSDPDCVQRHRERTEFADQVPAPASARIGSHRKGEVRTAARRVSDLWNVLSASGRNCSRRITHSGILRLINGFTDGWMDGWINGWMNSLIEQGVLTEKMNLLLGPLEDGSFHPVQVQSIQRHKSSCRVVRAGQSASLALNIEIPNIRKGMILAAPDLKPQATLYFQVIIQPPAEFHPISRACSAGMRTRFRRIWLSWIWFDLIWQATIVVLSHSTCIHAGFQTTVHIGSIQQTAVLEGIMSTKEIGTNDTASVLFRFLQHPEFIRTGSRLFFRTGITQASQGIGRVTQVFPVETGCHANWTSAADRNSEAKKKKKN